MDDDETSPNPPERASVGPVGRRVWSLRTLAAAAVTAVALSGAGGAALAVSSKGGSSGGPGDHGGFGGPPGQMGGWFPGGPPPRAHGVPGQLPPATTRDGQDG